MFAGDILGARESSIGIFAELREQAQVGIAPLLGRHLRPIVEQLVERESEIGGDARQQGDVGHALPQLPLRYGGLRHTQVSGKLALRHLSRAALARDGRSQVDVVHVRLLRPSGVRPPFSMGNAHDRRKRASVDFPERASTERVRKTLLRALSPPSALGARSEESVLPARARFRTKCCVFARAEDARSDTANATWGNVRNRKNAEGTRKEAYGVS